MDKTYIPPLIKRIPIFILVFIYMFSIEFVFAAGFGTRALIGAAGLVYLFMVNINKIRNIFIGRKFLINRHVFGIGVSLLSISLIAVLTDIINGTSEKAFMIYPISMILIFSGGYLVTDVMRKVYRRLDFELISSYFIKAVVVQLIIALMMFFIPSVKGFVATIVQLGDIALEEMLNEEGFRLMGFGILFFMAGIVNSFALLLIAIHLKYYSKTFRRTFFLTLAFIFVTAVGMMMSRTTMIGSGLALGMLAMGIKVQGAKYSKFWSVLKSLFVIVLIVVPVFLYLPSSTKEQLQGAGEYGFELFVNYFKTGEATTASSDQLKTMYDVYPQTFGTWIIGDGWFVDPNDNQMYYMHIDVGYLRLIFYSGLVGLLAFLIYQIQMLRYFNYLTNNRFKRFTLTVLLLLLVLNIKGFADITQLMALFLFIPSANKVDTPRLDK